MSTPDPSESTVDGAAIILAAGVSRRFGGDKRKLLIDGVPMLQRTVALYEPVFTTIIVVHRPDDAIEESVSARCTWVEAPEAHLGMSRSIAAGVAQLGAAPWVVIGLADMPFVNVSTLTAIVGALNDGAAIARPVMQERSGNPVGFNRGLFGELSGLDGDQGARPILRSHAGDIVSIEVADPGIFKDIDRIEDV